MAQHTPGPWKAVGGSVLAAGGEPVAIVAAKAYPNVGGVGHAKAYPLLGEVGHANACLIASAPDLLARATQAEALLRALSDDMGKLMQTLAEQTETTMRFRDACEEALAMLREDRPQAALALLEDAARA